MFKRIIIILTCISVMLGVNKSVLVNAYDNNSIESTNLTRSNVYTLNVPYYNQYDAGAPMGCEAASLLQALHYKNCAKEYNLKSFLQVMPYSKNDNPYEGYSGTPYEYLPYPTYQSIFPEPLTKWANKYGWAENISGCSVTTLQKEIKAGNPVVVYMSYNFEKPEWNTYPWGTGMDNMHVMTLCGYNESTGKYQVCDPVKGKYWVAGSTFKTSFNYLKFAVVVRTLDLCKRDGHDYGSAKYVVTSNTSNCVTEKTCKRCSYVLKETLSAHNYGSYVYNGTTSKCEGVKTCKKCGSTYKKTYDTHDYSEFKVTVKPTNTTEGERVKTCKRCSYAYKEVLIAHVYSDNYKGMWYYDTVIEASKLGIMTGLDTGDFGPNNTMNRGMVAIVFHRMEGSKKVEYSKVFPDVANNQYYTTSVLWAKANGIINGYTDGTFKPLRNVSREEMATMIYNFAKYKGLDVETTKDISYFSDYDKITSYAVTPLQWAIENGLMSGKDNGTRLDPLGTATRAECAKMLVQAYKVIYK